LEMEPMRQVALFHLVVKQVRERVRRD